MKSRILDISHSKYWRKANGKLVGGIFVIIKLLIRWKNVRQMIDIGNN